jgi:ribosomal protein S21
MINVQVEKQGTENSISVIRRFTKRVQGSGILRRARANRFYGRSASQLTKKKKALNGLNRRAKREELIKLGKISDQPAHKRGRRS